jgi:alpha-D-xyloside xylohydrolase
MLGDSLLVAPVFSYDNWVEYYVPAGCWTRLLDGTTVEGPGWKREEHSFLSLPLLVRPNSIVVTGCVDTRPDYQFESSPTIEIYGLEDGQTATAELMTQTGTSAGHVTASRKGQKISVRVDGSISEWTVQIFGTPGVAISDDT